MTPRRSIFAAAAIALLLLIAFASWNTPASTPAERLPSSPLVADDTPPRSPEMVRPVSTPHSLVLPVAGAASVPLAAAGLNSNSACQACRERECRDFQGIGVDIVDGCLKVADPAYGADPADADFTRDCEAVVECARRSGCASTSLGPADCYCGSASVEDCLENGPAPDAPCVDEWRRATRSGDTKQIAERFSDPKYPAGWGSLLIRCDREACKDSCAS